MLKALRNAGDAKFPTMPGISKVMIHLNGAGQNFLGPSDLRLGTQDFLVTYSEPR